MPNKILCVQGYRKKSLQSTEFESSWEGFLWGWGSGCNTLLFLQRLSRYLRRLPLRLLPEPSHWHETLLADWSRLFICSPFPLSLASLSDRSSQCSIKVTWWWWGLGSRGLRSAHYQQHLPVGAVETCKASKTACSSKFTGIMPVVSVGKIALGQMY